MGNEEPAADYARRAGFEGGWRDTWWSDGQLAQVAAAAGFAGAATMLDVGCGAGHWGQRWQQQQPRLVVTAVDREPAFVDAAIARAAQLGLTDRYHAVRAEVEALPFADASFDVVTCQTVLIHVADAERALAEMARVCRPGGVVVVAEPDNVANAARGHDHAPELTPDERLELHRFAAIAALGKRSLGHGDEQVGRRLPGLLAGAGLTVFDVWQNARCAWLVPPYADAAQALTLAHLATDEVISAAGVHDLARERYLAGGGDPVGFAAVWALVERNHRALRAAVAAGRFHDVGGHAFYLAAAHKPPLASPAAGEKFLLHVLGWQADVEWKGGGGEDVVTMRVDTNAAGVTKVLLRFDGVGPPTLHGGTLTAHYAPDRVLTTLAAMSGRSVVVHGRMPGGPDAPYVVVQCGDASVGPLP